MAASYLSIKKFDTYQHYKTRNPPWIKLYRSILNDYDMRGLTVTSRLIYICLLIIASETDNRIPIDYKFLSDRIGFSVVEADVTPLIDSGFLLASSARRAQARHALCSSLLSSAEKQPLNSLESLQSLHPPDLHLESKKHSGKSNETWEAYSGAYVKRYGCLPTRNAKMNSILCQLVTDIGIENAPMVAEFYLTHQGRFYTESLHPVNLLLRDAQKLLTELKTGSMMTATQARQADGKAARGQVWNELIEEFKQKEKV